MGMLIDLPQQLKCLACLLGYISNSTLDVLGFLTSQAMYKGKEQWFVIQIQTRLVFQKVAYQQEDPTTGTVMRLSQQHCLGNHW